MTLEEIRDRVIELERRAEKEDERHRGLEERLREVETTQKGILEIRLLIERLTMGNESMSRNFAEVNARLDKLDAKLTTRIEGIEVRIGAQEKKPGEKWEKATWAVTLAVISAAAGVAIGKLFL